MQLNNRKCGEEKGNSYIYVTVSQDGLCQHAGWQVVQSVLSPSPPANFTAPYLFNIWHQAASPHRLQL